MNKPAPKEPSMDEILSSIRQIIADDDAGAAPRPKPAAAPQAQAPRPMMPPASAAAPQPLHSIPPLALSSAQIMPEDEDEEDGPDFSSMLAVDVGNSEPDTPFSMDVGLVDPEDVAFDVEPAFQSEAEPEPEPAPWVPPPPATYAPPAPVYTPPPAPEPRPAARVAETAPMPDPTLSRDIAERLLEPTTKAAVRGTLSRLSGISQAGSGQTLEGMMREMLRPMLKDWLDEHLPAVVERMVEKEIERISRGIE